MHYFNLSITDNNNNNMNNSNMNMSQQPMLKQQAATMQRQSSVRGVPGSGGYHQHQSRSTADQYATMPAQRSQSVAGGYSDNGSRQRFVIDNPAPYNVNSNLLPVSHVFLATPPACVNPQPPVYV